MVSFFKSALWLAHLSLDPPIISKFLSNHDIWVGPFNFYGSQLCLAPKCSLLKNQHFGWFPSLVMVPSVVWLLSASAQNEQFVWFPSLFMVSSVVRLECVFHSKSIFWMVPSPSHGSFCCLVPSVVWLQCFPLKNNIFGLFPSLVMVPSVVWLLSAFCSKWTFCLVPFIFYCPQCCLARMCFPLKINILSGWTEDLTDKG